MVRFITHQILNAHSRETVYKDLGSDTICFIPYLFGMPTIYTCSLDVARQIVSTRGGFYKSEDMSEITL